MKNRTHSAAAAATALLLLKHWCFTAIVSICSKAVTSAVKCPNLSPQSYLTEVVGLRRHPKKPLPREGHDSLLDLNLGLYHLKVCQG